MNSMVADFCLGPKSEIVILWQDGTFSTPNSKKVNGCLAQDATWNNIIRHSHKECIISGYKINQSEFINTIFLAQNHVTKPKSELNIISKGSQDWLQISNIVKIHEKHQSSIYMAMSVCDYIHIFKACKSRLTIVKDNICISGSTLGGHMIDRLSKDIINVYVGSNNVCAIVSLKIK